MLSFIQFLETDLKEGLIDSLKDRWKRAKKPQQANRFSPHYRTNHRYGEDFHADEVPIYKATWPSSAKQAKN